MKDTKLIFEMIHANVLVVSIAALFLLLFLFYWGPTVVVHSLTILCRVLPTPFKAFDIGSISLLPFKINGKFSFLNILFNPYMFLYFLLSSHS